MLTRAPWRFVALLVLLPVLAAEAAEVVVPDPPVSLGQPRRWRGAGGVSGGYSFDGDIDVWRAFANWTAEGLAPNLGIDFMSLEAGLKYRKRKVGADVGYYVRVPFLRPGIEYDFMTDRIDFNLSLQFALRRGGFFRRGDEIRIDYRFRNNELMVGVLLNTQLRGYRRNRPIKKTIDTPHGQIPDRTRSIKANGLPDDIENSLQSIEHCVLWMDRLLTPRFFHKNLEERAQSYRDHIRKPGHTFLEEDARYHSELRRAFGLAIDDAAVGEQLAVAAEKIIFDEVVVPYNSAFGYGKDPWEPTGYAKIAAARFEETLQNHARFAMLENRAADLARGRAREVFRRVLEAIDDAAHAAHDRWKTEKAFWVQHARLVWLPLNYGLTPDQYDTQDEWDAITERLTTHRFTHSNSVEYMMNERFHHELLRMINATEVYHVLIIHDFTGRNADGSPDPYGWAMVTDGYMRAMIDAVKELDAGKREVFPQFMLFIDQNFYETNKCRGIVTYMENIFTTEQAKLAPGEVKSHVDAVHQELVEAVKGSKTFAGMDDQRLAKLFKVHVTVTNKWDPTFAFDIDKRDHRKFTFRDVFEDDPSRGEGILTGTGVGHHYQPPTWEDRAMGIKGPALIELKRAAERLCHNQGYRENEIPEYLRPRDFPADYGERCDQLWDKGWRANLLVTFNETGYGWKHATVQRAVMYNLAPSQSVLLAIDSLWLSDFWAGMFVSAALRGAHVYAIAPSPANAPSTANFTMYLMQQNLWMLIGARTYVADDLAAVGGKVYAGLYNHDYAVDDAVARVSAFLQNTASTPFIFEDFPLNPECLDLIRKYVDVYKTGAKQAGQDTGKQGEVKPFLHMKTQFFATDVALDVLRSPEWVPIVDRYMQIREHQLEGKPTEGMTPVALVDYESGQDVKLATDYNQYVEEHEPDRKDNFIMAFTIGSFNQDRRGMLSDGEILAVCSGSTGLIGVLDMISVAVSAAWPETREELDALFPEPTVGTRTKRLARYLQDFF